SFLVEEPEMALSSEGRDMIAQEEFEEASEEQAEVSGGSAVSKAADQNAMAEAEMAAAPMAMPTATPGLGGAGGEMDADDAIAAMPSVVTVGSKAFVFKDGIWTDTAYDSTAMSTTPLPFPSDAFLNFLTDNPDAGQYFALGSNVIVVIDGTAYETVEGEVDDVPERLEIDESEAKAEAEENVTEANASSQPANSITSEKPADADDIYTTITADVIEGTAPLVVNFKGELIGGADDNEDFYCVESTFDFGDGNNQSQSPGCTAWEPGTEISRDFTANTIYEEPGEYTVRFQLGEAESEPITIIVNAADSEQEDDTAAAPDDSEAEASTVSTTNTANNLQGTNCLSGLMLLPLAALVIGLRRGQA
ncbi:MAG: hypothetical protein KDJ65_37155, partial [Anaerolineae bacterium]|nr:hypothetical protein [Anaerolineae bacterium]